MENQLWNIVAGNKEYVLGQNIHIYAYHIQTTQPGGHGADFFTVVSEREALASLQNISPSKDSTESPDHLVIHDLFEKSWIEISEQHALEEVRPSNLLKIKHDPNSSATSETGDILTKLNIGKIVKLEAATMLHYHTIINRMFKGSVLQGQTPSTIKRAHPVALDNTKYTIAFKCKLSAEKDQTFEPYIQNWCVNDPISNMKMFTLCSFNDNISIEDAVTNNIRMNVFFNDQFNQWDCYVLTSDNNQVIESE
jgi:hypothetical protein